MLRVSAVAEQAGFPSVTLVCEGFLGQARSTASGMHMPTLPVAYVPGHADAQLASELDQNVSTVTYAGVIEGLTKTLDLEHGAVEPAPRSIVFDGDFDAVNEHFLANLWSDGLPIVPPTTDRIEAFLRFSARPADHVFGTLLPDTRRATVWNVAVNGVMAGCRPEYMPVLEALVEAMADPAYGLEHSGNTPGSETQIIVSGPMIKQLGFNYEQGALRDGFQANTSIGRFWRLYLRNVAGFLPHQNDKGTFGGTWRVVLAENEDVLAELGWQSVCVELGIAAGQNGVFIARYTGGQVIASIFGSTAEEVLAYIADGVKKHTGWELIFTIGMGKGAYRPLLILSPIIARTIARSGLSKADVKKYLFEHARISAKQFENYISRYTNVVPGKRTLNDLVAMGRAPKMFAESRDPERLVPLVFKPEEFLIAVSGDPLRTNCYFLAHNGTFGFPTVKAVNAPPDWPPKRQQ